MSERETIPVRTLRRLTRTAGVSRLRSRIMTSLTLASDSMTGRLGSIISETAGGTELRLNLMISYSGRDEILRACRQMIELAASGELSPDQFDEALFEASLFTKGLPDPDLLIRTSDEFRLSNFMLWQVAYTELHIASVLWPDFSREDLFQAVLDYQERDRRFGRVTVG